MTFPACENRLCIPITINDDHFVEKTESFNITLVKYSGIGNELTIQPSEGRIIIKDTDGMHEIPVIHQKVSRLSM